MDSKHCPSRQSTSGFWPAASSERAGSPHLPIASRKLWQPPSGRKPGVETRPPSVIVVARAESHGGPQGGEALQAAGSGQVLQGRGQKAARGKAYFKSATAR